MPTPRTDLATLDAELAAQAAEVSKQLGAPEARKITPDRNGNFIAAGGLNLGNTLRVAVVDFCSANDYYTSTYNPNNPEPPVCFARGYEIEDMVPEETSPEPQADSCAVCPHNQFGSRGNGKACGNSRLVVVALESDFEDEEDEPELHVLRVPPTALGSFDAAIKQASRMFNASRLKFIVTVTTVAKGDYNTLQFSSPEPNDNYVALAALRGKAEEMLARLPDVSGYKPQPARTRR